MTVNVCPPIVSVPLRAPAILIPTEKPTDPFPDPDEPDVTVSHGGALLAAVQGHPVAVVTVTVPDPPNAVKLELVGAIV